MPRLAEKRILSIGARLRDPRVDFTPFSSTKTLLEYDFVVWNPTDLFDGYTTGQSFKGSACLTDSSSAAYRRDAERRWTEFHDFLKLGRLMVVLLPTPINFYVATGQTENEGTAAKPRLKRLVESRGVDDLIPVTMELVAASGDKCEVVAGEPFATFWRTVGDQFHYSAYLREPVGTSLVAIKGTDRVVATMVDIDGGTVLLLPQRYFYDADIEQRPNETEAAFDRRWEQETAKAEKKVSKVFVDGLLDLAQALQGSPDDALPGWTERFALPGEIEAVAAVSSAEDKATRALQRAERQRMALKQLQRQKVLMAGSGRSLELAVERALTDLGCTVEEGEKGRTDRIVRWRNAVAVLEIKGLAKSARERDAAQLEKWVSEYLLNNGKPAKGVLFVNAWRSAPLDARDQPSFPPSMLPYAEGRSHCLATTAQLLAAVTTATTARDKNAFLKALFSTVGILDGWEWDSALEVIRGDAIDQSDADKG